MRLLLIVCLLVVVGCHKPQSEPDRSGVYEVKGRWTTAGGEWSIKCQSKGSKRTVVFNGIPVPKPDEPFPDKGEVWKVDKQPDGTCKFTERISK